MGLADKVIKRLERQAETIAEYRQLDDRRRSRISDLEGQLARLTSTCDAWRQDIVRLREENEKLKIELNCRQQRGGE